MTQTLNFNFNFVFRRDAYYLFYKNYPRDGSKHIQDIRFNPTINFFRTQEKHNIAGIKREAHNISCLESYKKQRDKDF